jgi:hypothetical protein
MPAGSYPKDLTHSGCKAGAHLASGKTAIRLATAASARPAPAATVSGVAVTVSRLYGDRSSAERVRGRDWMRPVYGPEPGRRCRTRQSDCRWRCRSGARSRRRPKARSAKCDRRGRIRGPRSGRWGSVSCCWSQERPSEILEDRPFKLPGCLGSHGAQLAVDHRPASWPSRSASWSSASPPSSSGTATTSSSASTAAPT